MSQDDDLIARLRDTGLHSAEQAVARITTLTAERDEARAKVIADVVAWCLREMYEPFTPLEHAKALKSVATALESGEWEK